MVGIVSPPNKCEQNLKSLYQIEGKKRMRQYRKVDIPQGERLSPR
jgi:hypothetical protein